MGIKNLGPFLSGGGLISVNENLPVLCGTEGGGNQVHGTILWVDKVERGDLSLEQNWFERSSPRRRGKGE